MADTAPGWRAGDWPSYFQQVAGLPPRETLIFALDRFGPGEGRLCVDLGCGNGRDAVEILRRGWRVIGVDSESAGIEQLMARIPAETQSRFTPLVASFEQAYWPECDFVNASFSIPHCSPRDFPHLWARIAASIKPGGRFAGQFFGVNDSWARKPDGVTRTYHTRPEVEAMLAAFDAEMLDEVERDGKNAFGEPKYWHVFHVVARKRPTES